MSIVNVSHVSHSFGGRQILEDVSFRLDVYKRQELNRR